MKNIFLLILFSVGISCTAQTYPLRTFTGIPENTYLKDTNNELESYEGIWTGSWKNKTIFITFKKVFNTYDDVLKRYRDYLIGKFKVLDANGNILFDNTSLPDDKAKIEGGKFRKIDDKYSLIYMDRDLCNASGIIKINFTDATKTKLNWGYSYSNEILTTDCSYYNTGVPQPFPEEIILTKQ